MPRRILALEPLSDFLARELDDPVRTACVEAIAGIGGAEATRLLVRVAVTDRRLAVRASALWSFC